MSPLIVYSISLHYYYSGMNIRAEFSFCNCLRWGSFELFCTGLQYGSVCWLFYPLINWLVCKHSWIVRHVTTVTLLRFFFLSDAFPKKWRKTKQNKQTYSWPHTNTMNFSTALLTNPQNKVPLLTSSLILFVSWLSFVDVWGKLDEPHAQSRLTNVQGDLTTIWQWLCASTVCSLCLRGQLV